MNASGNCEVPCKDGFTRTISTGALCVACDDECAECEDLTSYCTECSSSSLYTYKGLCLTSCPAYTTVPVGGKCVDCEVTCLTCEQSPSTCTSCHSGVYLYSTVCVSECPDGYYESAGVCEDCGELKDCPPSNSNETNTTNTGEEDDGFNSGSVPFPFTGFVTVSMGMVAVSKLAAAGVGFVPTTISIWGATAMGSWVFLAGYVPVYNSASGRRLFLVEGSGGDLVVSIAILLIVGALALHLLFNIALTVLYYRRVLKKDKSFKYWQQQHKWVHGVSVALSLLVSFHCIRLLVCGMCDKRAFKAEFDNKARLLKPLVKMTYRSIMCTCIPMIMAQVLLLLHYETSN